MTEPKENAPDQIVTDGTGESNETSFPDSDGIGGGEVEVPIGSDAPVLPSLRTKAKKKRKKVPASELGSDRGIETMFRTSYRVQLDLTSLADNKANIMISINGLIIPIMLFALVPLYTFNAWLLVPSAVLVFACLISIVYAVLSARPRISANPVTRTSIQAGKANILFFGNFAHLNEQQFLHGMRAMLDNLDSVYSSMMKDIYGMGKVLSKKFALLKKAYDVFVVGLIFSILLYMSVFFAIAMNWI